MNRLAHETSPYLLQHKDNPVDWYPWGEEALRRAQEEQRPIFLSIGYSACHWCHVMEHESFENEEIANQLNDRFVCIKVDREERPDLDQIYMNAVQMMTRHGGWPMSVFLTPDLQPFYGGTYWPPKRSRGMPGFDEVLAGVYDAWVNRQDQVVEQAAQITSYLQQPLGTADQSTTYDRAFFGSLVSELEQTFDFTYGGFGRAPKFPHTMDLQVLLRVWRDTSRSGLLEMVKLNLDKMARGGIYDHLAGGFARYSVDERWLVPHFEKMLYDNALLIGAYLDGFLATGDESYATVVRETSDFILGYMRDEQGGFHSTEDADSEGVEGKFYVWSLGEVGQVLGKDLAARFSYVFDVTESGNFEGQNILNLGKTLQQCADLKDWNLTELEDQMASCKERLLAVRDQRVRPGKDDKVLVSWNALMIDALARAGMALEEPAYLTAAANAARFILDQLRRSDGRLLHSWRHGSARFDAYLDDYAYLSNALVSLYQADFDERWIDEAVSLADVMLERFHDSAAGGFFFTADDHEKLIARNKDLQDASVPSGNAMAATALLRLAALCGRLDYRAAAEGAIELGSDLIQRAPSAAGQMAVAAHMLASAFPEIVIIADPQDAATKQVLASLRSRYLPNHVLALRAPRASGYQSPHLQPLFEGRESMDGQLTLFVCQQFTCRQPVVGLDAAIQACRSI